MIIRDTIKHYFCLYTDKPFMHYLAIERFMIVCNRSRIVRIL